ncbi:MAG: SRPBCC family protein [Candidatus Nanopelagicales bacterium]
MSGQRVPVRVGVIVGAPVGTVFDAFTQWSEQGRWLLGTRVEVRGGDGRSVGTDLAAWTGLGPAGFWDTMVITRWEPPYRVDVEHTGKVVRGTGVMEAVALPGARSRFVWSEEVDLPLGRLGRLGRPIARPAWVAAARRSLANFSRLVEQGALPAPPEDGPARSIRDNGPTLTPDVDG